MSEENRVVVAAPAKINLCLHVGDRRADGFHDLESLVAFATVGDVVILKNADALSLSLDGPFAAGLSAAEHNLALRASKILAKQVASLAGARIHLTKNLPVAAGLGGGSADAAAVLRGLVRLWNLDWGPDALRDLAGSLGADVPVCVESATAWMEGRGERITRLPPLPRIPLLLVNPRIPVPTGPVFARLKRRRGVGVGCPTASLSDVAALLQFLRATTNDLEEPARAIAPRIGFVLEALATQPGALLARMSGSGATCFGIFDSDARLGDAARAVAAQHPDWWVRKTAIASAAAASPVLV